MSTGTEPDDDGVPTTACRVCETDVPAGEFCGLCGCHLTPRRREGPDWLRVRNFGAAPGEHLLLPSLASSLFPHLPQRSRTPFRVGLAVVLLALVTFAMLRLPPPLIAVAALGLPLLFESTTGIRRPARSSGPHAASDRGVGRRAGCRVRAADRCDGRALLRRPTGCQHRGIPHAA